MSVLTVRARLVRDLRRLSPPGSAPTAFIASDAPLAVDPKPCHSNFFLALTLSAIQASGAGTSRELEDIRDGLARLLREETEERGTLNYWMRAEPLRTARPYPDDLDTTSCALAALSQSGGIQPSGSLLGTAVRALTQVEAQEGGPYRTWLVGPDADDAWKDVDIAVNANIAWLLSIHGIRLDALDTWLTQRIRAGEYTSPYYPSSHAIWYFLARGYAGDAREKLRSDVFVARLADGTWGTVLETALSLAALAYLDAPADVLTDGRLHLAAQIDQAEEIPAGALCIDSITAGVPMYAGSPALTAALCLEAFAGVEEEVPAPVPSVASVPSADEDQMMRLIAQLIERRAAKIGAPLGSQLRAWTDRIVAGSRGREIPLLPYWIHEGLWASPAPSATLRILGAANVYGWTAYTIYDDLLDGEGDSADLPVANICLRSLGALYAEVSAGCPEVGRLYQSVMDGIERANAWEAAQTHLARTGDGVLVSDTLPDYGDLSVLAERSFGHALGPLSLLLLAGHDRASEEVRNLSGFFRHMLIARQLDDDAHDWAEDLAAGRVNAVASMLLRAWKERGHDPKMVRINDLSELKQFFWEQVIQDVAARILGHLRLAEACLSRLSFFKNDEPLRALLAPTRASAEQALMNVSATKSFLQSYRGSEGRSA